MKIESPINKRIVALWIFIIITSITNAQFVKLHDFTGISDGYYPKGGLYFDGTFLYGTTYYGGTNNSGTIFRIKPDGTEYSKLFDFSSPNGRRPVGSLISDDTFLYGMTFSGGANTYDGVIFKIKPEGSGYAKLHDFDVSNEMDGGNPSGSLTYDGTYLYGMTNGGGSTATGIIFRIKPDGTEFTKLHDFIAMDGYEPLGSLISDGTFLYGMSRAGGSVGTPDGFGVIFRIKPDGSEYVKLMDFNGLNGKYPSGDLIYDGTFLFGMAGGGANEEEGGVIFKIKPDGSEYTKLWDFTGTTGAYPVGSLIYNETFLYGMTRVGGTNNNGVIFRLQTDGSEYTKLHDFPDTINGRRPENSLISDGTFLYGMTYYGGIADSGIVFKFNPLGTGVHKTKMEAYFTAYPNPCTNTVYVKSTSTDPKEIYLYDLVGKLVRTMTQCQNRVTAINMNGLNKGIYFLTLKTNEGIYCKKIIKH